MQNSDSEIRIAVIGAGYWGPNLVRNFTSLPGCRLVAVCDLNPLRLEAVATQYHVATTTHVDDILADATIEAVAIATPAQSHFDIGRACLQAGKHVYIEKPFTTNSRDAEELVRVAEEGKRILMVGHLFLYDSAIARLVELVKSQAIGKIRYAHGVRTSMAGTARLDTNIVWDALYHDAYVLPMLFGHPPRRVSAAGRGYLNPELEDVAFVTFDFGEGVLAHVYVSWYALEKARKITLIGSHAVLDYNDLCNPKIVLYERRYEPSSELDPQGRPRWRWQDNGARPIETEHVEPLRAECQHFIDCVRTGARPMTDGRAGVATVRVLEACQKSLKSKNAWVEVDL